MSICSNVLLHILLVKHVDKVSSKVRSSIMRSVKGKNSKPELYVRGLVHRAGYRFRLHVKTLPGSPDVVLPKYKTAVFVNGCFWHWHGCSKCRMPTTNEEYWKRKIEGNSQRDQMNSKELRGLGWTVFVIWECSLDDGGEDLLSQLSVLRDKHAV